MASTLGLEASSGYFRYRCRNFYTHNCDNWVWVRNTACAECVAAGREEQGGDGSSAAACFASVGAEAGRQCPMTALPMPEHLVREYGCDVVNGHDDDDGTAIDGDVCEA